MAGKLSKPQVVYDLGRALRKRLVNSCIQDFQKLKDSLLSGEDSGLRNTWDEICVQQQHELSIYWDVYEEMMDTFITHRVKKLYLYELEALWLMTPEGDDWDCLPEEERDSYPVVESDVVNFLQGKLLSKASDWSNERIASYLEQY